MEDFKWSCKSCKATFPSLENISCVLKDIQKKKKKKKKKTDRRIASLEERVTNVESKTTKTIKTSIEEMKSEVKEGVKDNLDKLVDARTKEIEDRKRREGNLVLFNLPENRSPRGEENKKYDEENFRELSHSLDLENPQEQICFRLGAYKATQNRPLKVIFLNKAHRKFLLDNAKNISQKAPSYLKEVIISKDLTPEQRIERQIRREKEPISLRILLP